MASFRSKKTFLRFWAGLFVVAYLWVAYNLFFAGDEGWVLCPFRRVTTLPCPGCGLTTAVLCVLKGEFLQAFLTHPLVVLAVPTLVVGPWLLGVFPEKCYVWWLRLENFLSAKRGVLTLVIVIGALWAYLISRVV